MFGQSIKNPAFEAKIRRRGSISKGQDRLQVENVRDQVRSQCSLIAKAVGRVYAPSELAEFADGLSSQADTKQKLEYMSDDDDDDHEFINHSLSSNAPLEVFQSVRAANGLQGMLDTSRANVEALLGELKPEDREAILDSINTWFEGSLPKVLAEDEDLQKIETGCEEEELLVEASRKRVLALQKDLVSYASKAQNLVVDFQKLAGADETSAAIHSQVTFAKAQRKHKENRLAAEALHAELQDIQQVVQELQGHLQKCVDDSLNSLQAERLEALQESLNERREQAIEVAQLLETQTTLIENMDMLAMGASAAAEREEYWEEPKQDDLKQLVDEIKQEIRESRFKVLKAQSNLYQRWEQEEKEDKAALIQLQLKREEIEKESQAKQQLLWLLLKCVSQPEDEQGFKTNPVVLAELNPGFEELASVSTDDADLKVEIISTIGRIRELQGKLNRSKQHNEAVSRKADAYSASQKAARASIVEASTNLLDSDQQVASAMPTPDMLPSGWRNYLNAEWKTAKQVPELYSSLICPQLSRQSPKRGSISRAKGSQTSKAPVATSDLKTEAEEIWKQLSSIERDLVVPSRALSDASSSFKPENLFDIIEQEDAESSRRMLELRESQQHFLAKAHCLLEDLAPARQLQKVMQLATGIVNSPKRKHPTLAPPQRSQATADDQIAIH